MDWNLFWTAFGAIGGTVGAFATFAAVLVALWQTRFSYKKKLAVSFTDDVAVIPENGKKIIRYVGVSVTNVGNRDVVIQSWGFLCHDKTKMLIVPDISPVGRMLQVQLPHRLQIEEGITLYYDKALFLNVLDEIIKKGALKPNKKVRFYVTDSTAKVYFTTSKKRACDFINESKTKNNVAAQKS